MATAGVGASFRRWSGSAWVAISEVRSITGPTMTRGTIDTTSLDTTGGYRTFITGFRDPGTISFNMLFNRDGYDLMKTDFESEVAQNYEIVLPDDDKTSFEFAGLVNELPITVPTDDAITCDITIKITGAVTVNSGSGS